MSIYQKLRKHYRKILRLFLNSYIFVSTSLAEGARGWVKSFFVIARRITDLPKQSKISPSLAEGD
ncbi:hypothetical protein [Helicobacter sp. T3_23-1059]